ncbi:hypothetical protein [Acinetobacter indicus]|nr:hypothetical protein [Acinetobacter indicus]
MVINTGAGFKTQPAVPFFADLKQAICMPFYGDLLSKHHLQNTLNASTLMP